MVMRENNEFIICWEKIQELLYEISEVNLHSLIKDNQHGFRQERSCLTKLLEFFEDSTATIDKENSVDSNIFTFSKALNKVPHQR